MKKETTTELKQELLELFFKMDRVESTQHNIESITCLYARCNSVSEEVKSEVKAALFQMLKDKTLIPIYEKAKTKIVRFLDCTLKLNDELYENFLDSKRRQDQSLTEGYRSFGREFGYKQNVQILCGMEDNLFRFC